MCSSDLKCPVIIQDRALRQDSGGPGKFRGGLGLNVNATNLVEGRWNLDSPRRLQCLPWGLWGGGVGDAEEKFLKLEGQNDWKKIEANRYPVGKNATAWVRTGSGGGWGDPLERDPAMVQWDVIEELVSEKAARESYGVVLHGKDRTIDLAATEKLRAEMKAQRGTTVAV